MTPLFTRVLPLEQATGFESYQYRIAPPWLQGTYGAALLRVMGRLKDVVTEYASSGAELRLPDYCSSDALAYNGFERNLERGLSESDDNYRAWLLRVWEHWTTAGTADSLQSQVAHLFQIDAVKVAVTGIWPFQTGLGVTRVVVPASGYTTTPQPGWEVHDKDTAQWARAWVSIDASPPWGFGTRTWDDGGTWDGDMVWDSLATPDEVKQVTNVLNKWKPAHVAIASFKFSSGASSTVPWTFTT